MSSTLVLDGYERKQLECKEELLCVEFCQKECSLCVGIAGSDGLHPALVLFCCDLRRKALYLCVWCVLQTCFSNAKIIDAIHKGTAPVTGLQPTC